MEIMRNMNQFEKESLKDFNKKLEDSFNAIDDHQPIRMYSSYFITPSEAMRRLSKVAGFSDFRQATALEPIDIIKIVNEVDGNWAAEAEDEDCGFGTSDMTYLLQEVIDNLIDLTTYRAGKDSDGMFVKRYKTTFPADTHCLTVIELETPIKY